MTKVEAKQQAQGAIAQVRALYPGKRFMFCCAEAGGRPVFSAVVEGETKGPTWPTVPESAMYVLQVACNEALGITDTAREEIIASVGHGRVGDLTIKRGNVGDLSPTTPMERREKPN